MVSNILKMGWALSGFVCLIIISGCHKSGRGFDGQDNNADNIAPSAITDLTVTGITPNAIGLRWTVSGDDNDSGTAVGYCLKYSIQGLTPDLWDSATLVISLPVPGPSGTTDSTIVTGLLEDSTYYFAIKVVDEIGNWSGLSNVVMAMCFDDFPVIFPDTALDRLIRFKINKPTGDIMRSDLIFIDKINAENQHIHNLSGIQYCRTLQTLLLWHNNISDLTPLEGLRNLRVLKIGYNGLSEITPLAMLTSLDTLHLSANSISDISALGNMNNLLELNLIANDIWNLAPLADKTSLRNLLLDENEIVFISPLYNLMGLEKLSLTNNRIDDILGLVANPGLGVGDTIWLAGNPLSAQSTDSLVMVLQNRGVVVNR